MAKRKTPPPSLSLFGERPTRERAWELVGRAPIGAAVRALYKRASDGRRLGPYYEARWYDADGKAHVYYLGPETKRLEYLAACEVVGDELEAAKRAAETPAARRAAELEAKARGGKVKRAKDPARLATIPILRMGLK